jgi:two-component system, sensor histidine kinase and response regulator
MALKYHILVVDDEPINHVVARGILSGRGFAVQAVGTGSDAVAAVAEGHIDLVLMDISMPVMDGFQALASIRAWEASAGTHLPVIALTAHAGPGYCRRCLDAGFDGYLTKPVSAAELLATLDGFLPPGSP